MEWLQCAPRHVREGFDDGPLTSRDIVEMRCYLRIRNRETAWGYTDKQKKQLYIRVAIKKLDEEDEDFASLKPKEQLALIVERAKKIAVDQANDDNEFYARDAEGNVLDDEGNVDPEATREMAGPRFGDGSEAEVGQTKQRGRRAGEDPLMPKTFGKK